MKRILFFCILLFSFAGYSQNPFVDRDHAIFHPPLSGRNVGYKITVTLDTLSHIVKGKESIYWLNNTQFSTKVLYFHLYMNAFKNNSTIMMKNIEKLRHKILGIKLTPETAGYCSIKNIAVNFNNLTDYFHVEGTVGVLHLPFDVKPGESVMIELEFETKLPRIMIRSGYAGSFHFVGQWYPKLGVFQDNGKWYCPEYDGNGEFFSDFGVYQVKLTLPSYFIVTGTGLVVSERIEGDVRKVYFYAEDVHDFAFVAWDKFRVLSKKVKGKTLYVYYFKEHEKIAKRELDALERVFNWYNKNIGEYPYPDYKVIDVPFNGLGASGMEYENFSTSFSLSLFPDWLRATESTVVHEFGHAYWQGMVATNEHRQAWADEGLNSFFEGILMDRFYGECSEMKFHVFCENGFSRFESPNFEVLKYEKPDKEASEFVSRGSYGLASYNKFALTLKTIANLEGEDVVIDAAREFFNQYKFKHPDGKEFVKILNEKTDNKYKRLLNLVLFDVGFPDAKVLKVEKKCEPYFIGYNNRDVFYREREKSGKRNCKSYFYRVVVAKRELPLDVNGIVTFKSGKVEHFIIPADKNIIELKFPVEKTDRLESVYLDPDRKIMIDLDRSNNLYRYKPSLFENRLAVLVFNMLMELFAYVF